MHRGQEKGRETKRRKRSVELALLYLWKIHTSKKDTGERD